MGHDGAFAAPGEGSAESKKRALIDAGVIMVDHPSKFGEKMKSLLSQRSGARRSMHTMRRRPTSTVPPSTQKRHLTLAPAQGLLYLKHHGIPVSNIPSTSETQFVVTFGVDRSFYQPRVHIRRSPNQLTRAGLASSKILYELDGTAEDFQTSIAPVVSQIMVGAASQDSLTKILHSLASLYRENEGNWFRVEIGDANGRLEVVNAELGFDDWAYAMSKRQKDVHRLRNVAKEVAKEVEAEKDGIVYVRLPGDGKVGTLVNGAGLAMNTTDALATAGYPAANFLDTGGKATAETVRSSFRAVLSDSRVKAVFVNIFGGLTRCEMIAEGIILAYKKEGITLPVVVRLRGTNEEEGRRVLKDSGLNLTAVEDFQEGVRKIGEAIDA
jgi:succinyl-CoA synthetase alpha subunit